MARRRNRAQSLRAASGLERSVFSAGRRDRAAALFVVLVFSSAFWGCLLWSWLVLVLVFGLSAFLSGGVAVVVSSGLLALLVRLVFGFFGGSVPRGLGFVALVRVFVGAASVALVLVLCLRCLFSGCVGFLVGRFPFVFWALIVGGLLSFSFGLLLPFEGVFSACAVFRRGLFFTRQTKTKKQKGGGNPPPPQNAAPPPKDEEKKD